MLCSVQDHRLHPWGLQGSFSILPPSPGWWMEFGTIPATITLLTKKTQQTREKVISISNLWVDSSLSQPSRVALTSLQ